jgi:urease accessory protein
MTLHAWTVWQLADSAFPTGGFAHSGGLEAAWQAGEVPDPSALRRFVHDALVQSGRGSLPWMTAAHTDPDRYEELDAMLDLFLNNAVANRASRVQGRAFLATCVRIWPSASLAALDARSAAAHGHAAPVVGAAFRQLGVPLGIAQRLFLHGVARGVLAAAVRLGIVGSYHAQRLQYECGPVLDDVLARCAGLTEGDAAQTAPLLDVLQAAHDRLYSRLFQS